MEFDAVNLQKHRGNYKPKTVVNALMGAEKAPVTHEVVFSFLIVFLPLTHQYNGPGGIVSFGELLLFPFLVAYLIADGNKLRKSICTPLLLFYISVVFTSLTVGIPSNYFVFYDFLTVFARLCFYGVLILVARSRFTLSQVLKLYLAASTVFALYLIVQYLYHSVIGGYLPVVIDRSWIFAPELTYGTYEEKYRWSYRASSAFLEPSYYVIFTAPALAISLMGDEKKGKSLKRFILLALTYVLANTSSGIMLAVIVLLFFMITKKKSRQNYIAGALLCAILLVYFAIGDFSFITPALERISGGASFDNRITRGFYLR